MAGYSYDLVIVGAGSGNMLPAGEFAGWRIAVVESGRFGGTCLNRGCIPSKMLVHTADVAQAVRHAGRFGIAANWAGAGWPAIRGRVFGRIDPVHERAVGHRRSGRVGVFLGEARFVAPKVLTVGDDEIRAGRFVLAAGSRPAIPAIDGLAGLPYLTSDTVMGLGRLPRSMAGMGGGYIAAEMSHIFGSLGTKVTIVARGEHLLARHDADIRARFTQAYRERFDLRLGATAKRAAKTRKGIRLDLATPAGAQAANAETRLVRYNLPHPGAPRRAAFTVVPSAVFAGPQVASVGATEQDLQAQGRDYATATRPYRDTAYGWALEDTTSFVKVLADPATRLPLGAHIIGPQAATLIQPLIQAMCLGNTADQVASGVLYIHPALTEVVEQALLELCS